MSTHAGDIFIDAKLNDKEYKKGLSNLQSSTSVIAKKLGKMLTIGAFVKFAKDATSAGASLNAMGTIIDASLPNMTKQVDEFAKSAGNMFGLSETQAKGFVGKFASMASAMGYTEKQAYNMSTALTGLAGDVASYYHINADEAYAKLGAVFTGETEALKQLGVVMTQNALDQFALQQGFGKTTAQMTELEKTTLRYQFVMDRLKLASGDFAKYANTWSGSIATIKLNWANFMATIGQGMINILLPLLQLIARISSALTALGSRFLAWSKAVTGKAKGFNAIREGAKTALGKATQKDAKNASKAIGGVGDATKGVGGSAKKAKKQVQALKRELLGFDKITKLTKQDTSTGTGGGGGAGGGGGGGVDFGSDEDEIKSFTERAKDYLAGIKLPPELSVALKDLKQSFSRLFDVLKSGGKWAYEKILKPLGKWTIEKLAPKSVKLLANVIDMLAQALKLVGAIIKPLWEPVIKPFFKFLGGVAIDATNKAIKIVNAFTQALKVLTSAINNVVAKIREYKDRCDSIKPKVATLNIKDNLSSAISTLQSKWKNFNLKDKVGNVKLSLTNAFSSVYNALARKINNARSNSIVKKLFPSALPYLAQGGYVKANTPQIAVIGDNKREGEIVAPESKLRAMAQEVAGTSNTQMITLLTAILNAVNGIDPNIYLDGESIKNNTVRRINNHTRATGQLEIIV